VLQPIFERFVAHSPVSVMVQATIEHALNASQIDDLFQRHSQHQYTRSLFFSSVVDLLTQVVCGVRSSIHAAYQAAAEPLGISLTSVYNKLNGVEPEVAAELVRHSARQLAPVIDQLGGALQPWLPGFDVRVLDGNHLAATEHRLQETRDDSAGPLPAMVLAVLDPARRLIVDVFPCEDAHTQERALLGDVLERVADRQLWLADRNFCVRSFLVGLAKRGAFFVIRQHAKLAWKPAGKLYSRGRIAEGRLREQKVKILDDEGKWVVLRRVTLELDEPSRDGETEIVFLTNLPAEEAAAGVVAKLYRKRWTIEGAFQELATALNSEIATLCYPRAALLAFCAGVLAYNVLGVVKGALQAEHGEAAVEEISGFHLAQEIGTTRRGMMISIPEEEWRWFATLSAVELAAVLRELAGKVRMAAFKRKRRGPKKPTAKRNYNPNKPHVSTARILDRRKSKETNTHQAP